MCATQTLFHLTYLFLLLPLLAILASSFTLLYLCLIIYLTYLNLVSLLFVILDVFAIYALDLNTAKTIATSLVHSRLDYCNSLFLNLPSSELNRQDENEQE